MKRRDKMQRREEVPWWLKRLDVVRQELRGVRFPRTAEEGVRQCAELSEASMMLLKEEVGRALRTRNEETIEMETRRLMCRFSSIGKRWKAIRRNNRVTPEES